MMAELKDDLKKCKITFDKVVMITDLVDEYKKTVEEINKVLEEYVGEQETKGSKFEKRYLVTGELKGSKKEVFNIVEKEATLKDWLHKLENAESVFYSLQTDGGAKKLERTLKPAQHHSIKIDDKGRRPPLSFCTANGSVPEVKSESKPTIKKGSIANAFAKKPAEVKPSAESAEPKKSSPEVKQATPEEKKPISKNAASSSKKGINSFFSQATPVSKHSTSDKKDGKANGVIKPPTPKKMEHFFKKQLEKPASQPVKAEATKEIKKEPSALVNTSVQLFNAAEDEEEEEESSDEEEKLEALKRDIISSDHEMENEEQNDKPSPSISTKRRRILDSDEEEDEEPQKKKKESQKETSPVSIDVDEEDAVPQSETFLDEDGFVMTIKNKKSNTTNKAKSVKKSPPISKVSRKSPMKAASGSSASSAKGKTTAAASKVKHGNIMSFFTKK